jgi:hypothetical protein
MFYTLVSRSVITKINTSRDYLNIFLIGSIGYVILHWYLYSEKKEGIMEKLREYLYYMMVVDIVTSYISVTFYPSKSDKKSSESEELPEDVLPQQQYSPEERQLILQRMQNSKKLQQQKIKDMMQKENNVNSPPHNDTNLGYNSNPDPNSNPGSNSGSNSGPQVSNEVQKNDPDVKTAKTFNPIVKSIFTKSEESNDSNDSNDSKILSNKSNKSDKKQSDIKVKKKKDTEISDTELPIFNGQVSKKKSSTKNDESSS